MNTVHVNTVQMPIITINSHIVPNVQSLQEISMGENNGTIINLIRPRAIPVNISGRNGNQTFLGGVSQSTEHFEQ